jgi:hypothetical protein
MAYMIISHRNLHIYNGSMINDYPYEMIWIMITTITLLKSGSWINDYIMIIITVSNN